MEVEGALMWARAIDRRATPGARSDYGYELDLDVRYSVGSNLELHLGLAGLLPGGALAAGPEAPAPDPVYTGQIDLHLLY